MEYSTSTRSVVVPRCETCNGKFAPKTKVSCADCECKIHYDCAVYADDDCSDMLCLNCFKNKKIEKGLERDGIYVKVKGDDLVRAYIGKHYWNETPLDKKIKILDECSEEVELEYEDINNDACVYCGWRCEYPQSHIEYGNFRCKYITDRFYLDINTDGELTSKVKCAYGYCQEDLYNRGCLKGWEKMWICDDCKLTNNPPVCGRHLGFGEYCEEKSSYPYEYCKDCMKHELGMY